MLHRKCSPRGEKAKYNESSRVVLTCCCRNGPPRLSRLNFKPRKSSPARLARNSGTKRRSQRRRHLKFDTTFSQTETSSCSHPSQQLHRLSHVERLIGKLLKRHKTRDRGCERLDRCQDNVLLCLPTFYN